MSTDLIKYEEGSTLPAELVNKLAEQSRENLEGVAARLPKIQMPTGKAKQFTITNKENEEVQVNDLNVVILYQTPSNAYWSQKFGSSGASVVPDCASHDAIKPSPQYEHLQSPLCATCKHNKFGSATDDAGQKMPGKACRNVKRVVVLRVEDSSMPFLLTIPPSSMRAFEDYLISLRKLKRPYWSLVTKMTLKTEKSRTNIEYPQLVLSTLGFINDPNLLTDMESTRTEWTELLKIAMFTVDETVAVEADANFTPTEQSVAPDGKVPF